ncbi:hypothetical protein DYI26_09140 [Halomonas litopenaei]|nr:hypothetical protein [Halomonas litopenaei]
MAAPVAVPAAIGFALRWGIRKVLTAAMAILTDIGADSDTDIEDIEDTTDKEDTGDVTTVPGSKEQDRQDGETRPSPEPTADTDTTTEPDTTSDADTRTDTDARTRECDEEEECNDCKPVDGFIFQPLNRNYHTGGGDWVFYQLYVANMGGGPIFAMVNGKIQEWKYRGVDFDGFWSNSCTLVEAKKGYERFFVVDDEGIITPRNIPFMESILEGFHDEADSQLVAIADSRPSATLRWYFSEKTVYLYFKIRYSFSGKNIESHFLPYSYSMYR